MRGEDYLGKIVQVTIDRPLGSKHPKYELIYPINYGFVPNTLSGDGEELDAYVLCVDTPLRGFEGLCIGLIKRKDEDDDKLILVPEGIQLSRQEILAAIYFQEQYFKSELILAND